MLAAKSTLSAEEYGVTEANFYKVSSSVKPNKDLKEYYERKYQSFLKLYPAIKEIEI